MISRDPEKTRGGLVIEVTWVEKKKEPKTTSDERKDKNKQTNKNESRTT